MLSDLMKRVQDFFKPYTLEQFIEDHNPVDHKDVQRLENLWHHYRTGRAYTTRY